MSYKINKDVKICVDSKDRVGLKHIFADCLDADPTFDESKYDYEYCKQNAKWLFEEYKELTPLSQNKSDWNQKYWAEIKFDLENNFCDKRFQHMVKVAQVVYKDKIERLKKERQSKSEKQRTEIEEKKRALEEENRRIEQQQYQQIRSQKPAISASERQRIEIEEKKRALEEENRRIEQQEQQEQSYTEKKYQQSNGDSSKKAFGVVLLVIIVMAVVAIIKLVLL